MNRLDFDDTTTILILNRAMKKPITMRMSKALGNPRYRGKHVLLVQGKVIAAGPWRVVSRAFDQVMKEGKTPTLTYIPKADSLILIEL